MADINPNDSATLTDGLEIDSYDDVVNLLGAGEAAAMLADAVGNRFNRQDIMKAILNGGDIHLDYWPEYGEYDYAARICGELLADTSLAWAVDMTEGGRIEYSEKKPKAVVAVKPDPVELGHRASVAASSTVGDRARGAGIRQ